ncbi:hypothetical protein QGM67_18255 [Vibrio cholerae]|uniref:hypothetical protein n=1 Tax=Vibrio cholerae TaxID=666 RepID=UPI00247ACB57|nr:hypothetical protein [Vibrio cholerae]EKF9435934.1 hypothetical protein [Vibrio cholerae]MDH7616672.1 hypothetical protein [Vibrio cholerae]
MNNSTDDNVDIDQILEETEAFLRDLDKLLGSCAVSSDKEQGEKSKATQEGNCSE